MTVVARDGVYPAATDPSAKSVVGILSETKAAIDAMIRRYFGRLVCAKPSSNASYAYGTVVIKGVPAAMVPERDSQWNGYPQQNSSNPSQREASRTWRKR